MNQQPITAAQHLLAAERLLTRPAPGVQEVKRAELHVKAARLRHEMTWGRDRVHDAVMAGLRGAGVVANRPASAIAEAVTETWEGSR